MKKKKVCSLDTDGWVAGGRLMLPEFAVVAYSGAGLCPPALTL